MNEACRSISNDLDPMENINITETSKSSEVQPIDIKIQGPNATMIHNIILDNSREIIDAVGIQGFVLIIILARYQFGFDTSGQCSVEFMSNLTGLDEKIVRGYCKRMARKGYITKCDGDSWELNCN